MIPVRTERSALVVALVLALACACVSERSRRLGSIEPWPPGERAGEPKAISLRIYGNLLLDGSASDLSVAELVRWRDGALQAYRESGLFSSVEVGWSETDWIAEIGFVVRARSPGKRALGRGEVESAQSELILRTRFRDRSGRSRGAIEVSEVLRSYSPIKYVGGYLPNRLQNEVIYDLHRATLLRALGRGILAPAVRRGADPGDASMERSLVEPIGIEPTTS
jgi:hypothetical protein